GTVEVEDLHETAWLVGVLLGNDPGVDQQGAVGHLQSTGTAHDKDAGGGGGGDEIGVRPDDGSEITCFPAAGHRDDQHVCLHCEGHDGAGVGEVEGPVGHALDRVAGDATPVGADDLMATLLRLTGDGAADHSCGSDDADPAHGVLLLSGG